MMTLVDKHLTNRLVEGVIPMEYYFRDLRYPNGPKTHQQTFQDHGQANPTPLTNMNQKV